MSAKGVTYVESRQQFDLREVQPPNASVIEVQNPRGDWIEARFALVGDTWQLEFAADDICQKDEALEFFSVWREHVIKPMTLKEVING